MPARVLVLLACLVLPACTAQPEGPAGLSFAATEEPVAAAAREPPLFPNETPALRVKINRWADHYALPRALVHRLAVRESTHRPRARNGPYLGLLQIRPQTARTMGFEGASVELLDADTNLEYALKYLRGAWIVADGDPDAAISWYARGYYYEAKRQGKLVETGLRPG
jgi:soluble lytic murein transglycosylase-like protein